MKVLLGEPLLATNKTNLKHRQFLQNNKCCLKLCQKSFVTFLLSCCRKFFEKSSLFVYRILTNQKQMLFYFY